MPTALVTGATGTIGRWAVDALDDAYDVVGVDLERPADASASPHTFRAADLTVHGTAMELVTRVEPELVVHLAAIPGADHRSETETFMRNTASTHHVLDAAGRVGARVVWTSSEATYGVTFGDEARPLEYLPIDESHPQRPLEGYGLSKVVGETVAERTSRRYGVSVVSLQPSWVQVPGAYETTRIREAFDLEDPTPSGSLWSYIDVRDVASLVVAAAEADCTGHERYLAVAPDNYLGVPTATAIDAAWDGLPERCALTGDQSAFTAEKAERELGWTPEHTWRDAADASVSTPEVGR